MCFRDAGDSLCEMKAEVNKEITEMERLLAQRMKSIIAGNQISYDNATDLASMQIINQVNKKNQTFVLCS